MSATLRFFALVIGAVAIASGLVFALINVSAFASLGDFARVLLLVVLGSALAALPNLLLWSGLLVVVRRRGAHFGWRGHAVIAMLASLPLFAVALIWLGLASASASEGITRSLLPLFVLPTFGVALVCIGLAVVFAVWRDRLGLRGVLP